MPLALGAGVQVVQNNAICPQAITITRGGQLTIINQDSRSHDMTSDEHPDHLDCPEINQVGFLGSGQSRETGNLVAIRTCGFHDHNAPDNASLKGHIITR
jgi:hypothetical protein